MNTCVICGSANVSQFESGDRECGDCSAYWNPQNLDIQAVQELTRVLGNLPQGKADAAKTWGEP